MVLQEMPDARSIGLKSGEADGSSRWQRTPGMKMVLHVPLKAAGHRPHDVVGVERIDVVVDDDHLLEFAVRREGDQSRLPLPAFVVLGTLAHLQYGQVPATARGVAVDVLENPGMLSSMSL